MEKRQSPFHKFHSDFSGLSDSYGTELFSIVLLESVLVFRLVVFFSQSRYKKTWSTMAWFESKLYDILQRHLGQKPSMVWLLHLVPDCESPSVWQLGYWRVTPQDPGTKDTCGLCRWPLTLPPPDQLWYVWNCDNTHRVSPFRPSGPRSP